jgi:predicted Zn-dependent protease
MCRKRLLAVLALCLLSGLRAAGQETDALQHHEAQKRKRIGVKDDIQAIGTRNLGGKGLGNWYSPAQELGMGREYSHAIEATVQLLTDPVVTEYVNRIGQNLVRNSDAKVPFTIKVIDSEEINAFALPGGFLYVTSGLVLATQEEAELAGAMAHEVAHVAAHHAARQMTHSHMFDLASIPLVFVGGGLGIAVREAVELAVPLVLTKFSRRFEAEADYLGVEYLYQAGYDPQAFISFFERIQAKEEQKPGIVAKIFSDHPPTANRIHKTQSEITKILLPREAYLISTSDFDEVKARLATIESRQQPREQEPNRSTPQGRSPTDDGDQQSDDDKRPTLKRRSD